MPTPNAPVYIVERREITYFEETSTESSVTSYVALSPEKARSYARRNRDHITPSEHPSHDMTISYFAILGIAIEAENNTRFVPYSETSGLTFLEYWDPEGQQIPRDENEEDWLLALRAKDSRWYHDNTALMNTMGVLRCQAMHLRYATPSTWPQLVRGMVDQIAQERTGLPFNIPPHPAVLALEEAVKESVSRMAPLLSAQEKSKVLATLDKMPSFARPWFISLVGPAPRPSM